VSYDNYCKHCEHDHTAASVLRGEQLKIRKRLEAELEQARAELEGRYTLEDLCAIRADSKRIIAAAEELRRRAVDPNAGCHICGYGWNPGEQEDHRKTCPAAAYDAAKGADFTSCECSTWARDATKEQPTTHHPQCPKGVCDANRP
jgi:hypothetical protein